MRTGCTPLSWQNRLPEGNVLNTRDSQPAIVMARFPAGDGWRTFTIDPDLGELEWATAVVPTPYGSITVRADKDGCVVDFPAELTMLAAGTACAEGGTVTLT